jgi:hypothetical protein
VAGSCENGNEHSGSIIPEEFICRLNDCKLPQEVLCSTDLLFNSSSETSEGPLVMFRCQYSSESSSTALCALCNLLLVVIIGCQLGGVRMLF